jgi:hypothetical protein
LVLLGAANDAGRLDNLRPDFKGFFDSFFAIGGSPAKWPYYVPFGSAGKPEEKFFNRNVAGSYAPSSIRPVNPLRKLASLEATPKGHLFSLVPQHAEVAQQMLHGAIIPGASLAAYLYRDYGFESAGTPDPGELYRCLRSDFGFAFSSGTISFEQIFADDTTELGNPFELRSGML